jgi:hypothetical protein
MTETLLERRRIEAEFARDIFDVLEDEIGTDRAVAILTRAIARLAKKAGADFASAARGGNDLLTFAGMLAVWGEDDAVIIDLKRREADRLDFNVIRCRYAEMYRELDISGLGAILSCNRDGAFCTGFNPAIRLARTQTIMAGADHCDFRFSLEPAGAGPAGRAGDEETQSDQLGADDGERPGE